MPLTTFGSGILHASRIVGTTSMHVVELVADFALRLDPLGPVDDQRVARAAEVAGDLLGPLERGVHRPGPADRDVRLARRPADLVDPLDRALQAELHAEQAGDFAERPFQPAFGAGAVVADDVHDQRVVEFAGGLQAVDQPADVVVGVRHVARRSSPSAGCRPSSRPPTGRPTAGISFGRGVSFVPLGMMPISSCFAWVISRCLSQPWSNLPLYFSRHSFGAWCGAWTPPVLK